MITRPMDWALAFLGGVLLALMINYNSLLARFTSPIFASWIAHGIGTVGALTLVALLFLKKIGPKKAETKRNRSRTPFWIYLGGVPGTLTVIFAAITVNSSLSLSGSIALMLVGQVAFGILSDFFGWFGLKKRRITFADFGVALLILAGSMCIIFGRVQ